MDPKPNGSHTGVPFASATPSVAASSAASTSPAAHVSASPTSTATPSASAHPGIKRRAPVACRRCRRMRSKCIHDKATPPCKSCTEAGLGPEDCIFPTRGQPDHDRDYRHPRTRAERTKGVAAKPRPVDDTPTDPWHGLPPLEDLIDGVHRFTRYYFQLGFIAKKQYPEKLRRDHRSCNLFLLLSILSISARLSPALRGRFGTGVKAAEFFMEQASEMTLSEIYAEPTLERCQAFYLLSIAQQGSGLRNKSYINMGVAIRMATLMMLHREETYQLQHPTTETTMVAESARRTIWMLHSQDNLHSGPLSPISLSASDITTLLPCDEDDFSRGVEPASRAALDGTPPAIENPALIFDKNRSLFASLMQIHHLWGTVSRRTVAYSRSPNPWDANSEFSKMATTLNQWEAALPTRHLFSTDLLRHYKDQGEDLAYLCVTMMTRLCNIVLRRPYLADMIRHGGSEQPKHSFFSRLALDLFRNVCGLYAQIEAQFTDRTPDESVGAQIASFCIYSCGLFATYLCRFPSICPDPVILQAGPGMLERILTILNECKEVWPLAARWADSLAKFARDYKTLPFDASMDDGKDPIPRAIRSLPPPISKSAASVAAAAAMPDRALPLPGTQPPLGPSTAMTSPHNNSIPHGNPASGSHLANRMSQPRSPGPQQHQQLQHNSHLSDYQISQPSPASNQYLQPPQHQFGNSHHHGSPPQQPPLQPFAGDTPQQHHQLPSMPMGPSDQHPRSVFWTPAGATPAVSSPLSPANHGRLQQDGVGMLIEAFDNQQQHGYLPNMVMSPISPDSLTQQMSAIDGFEDELLYYIQGSPGFSAIFPTDQWHENGMFT